MGAVSIKHGPLANHFGDRPQAEKQNALEVNDRLRSAIHLKLALHLANLLANP